MYIYSYSVRRSIRVIIIQPFHEVESFLCRYYCQLKLVFGKFSQKTFQFYGGDAACEEGSKFFLIADKPVV